MQNLPNNLPKGKKYRSILARVFTSKTFLIIVSLYFIVIIELLAMTVYAKANVAYNPNTPTLYVPKKITSSKPLAKPQAPSFDTKYAYKLTIGQLKIDTGVLSLGINAKGEMAVPTTLTETAWYNKGAKPGEMGSVVIAGHYGAPWQAGVFRSLPTMKVGDIVTVTDTNNKTYNYRVYKVANVPEKGADLKEIFNKNDNRYLNLITCFGEWNQDSFRYSERTVVFTKFVN